MENKSKEFPAILDIFECGYGESIAQTLLDSIDRYATAFETSSTVFSEYDTENVCNLVLLLKAVLKDCCGVNVK